MEDHADASPSPALLQGIRIVDLTTVVFGPFATQMLADLGADVIKVEAPGGDQFRYVGKPKVTRGMGPCHLSINRGKRSVVLDLKTEADREAMRELIASADVFIHNVRKQAIEKLGFGAEACVKLKPDLVYVHCVGFGSGGPYADLQAYDDVIQAASGTASLLPRADGNARPRYLPSLIADKVSGLYGAQAVLAAVVHKLRTGRGQVVEVPMFEAFTHFMLKEHLFGAAFDPQLPGWGWGYPRQLDPERQPFPTADGWISIVPYTDESVGRVFEVLGAPEVMEDERFATPLLRAKAMTEIYAEMAKLTPARTTAEWIERLTAARIPAMAVRDLADMLDDPHLQAVSFFQRREHPTEGEFIEIAAPIRFSEPPPPPGPAPGVGEHTEAVLGRNRRPRPDAESEAA